LLASQEQERTRIAGELHDSLSQDLQLIKNRAQMALNYLSPTAEMQAHLTEISAISAKAIAGTRAISYALRPPEFERFGLTRAIELMVEQVAQSAGFQAAPELESIDGLLSNEQQLNVYRILQECLNNVVKHAQAARVIVTAQRQGRQIEISVFDNGCGFAPADPGPREAAPSRVGLGLNGMQERARILGGKLEIQSTVGIGTRLTLVIPVTSPLTTVPRTPDISPTGKNGAGVYAR
jgi:two-component system, sensor histidine kinase LadS